MAESWMPLTDTYDIGEAVSVAARVICDKKFDYFKPESKARAHIEAEDISPAELSETSLGYTKVPRNTYARGLRSNLFVAFKMLAGEDPRAFLHYDRYGITAGRTKGGSDGHPPHLHVYDDERQCSLELSAVDSARLSLIPRQGPETPRMVVQSGRRLELPLGRSVIAPVSIEEERDQALRDRYRDWEQVLVVGDKVVKSFAELARDPMRELGEGQERLDRLARNGVVAGAVLSLINPQQYVDA